MVWALALAYKKIMDGSRDLAIIYLLEQSAVKCMRGLMKAMMGQIDKVEKFKTTFSRKVHLPGVPKMLGEVCPSPKRTSFLGHPEC